MAENLKAIKEQIGSVAKLKKITRAMEMVARSKMKRAIDAAVASRPYTTRALELLHELREEEQESTHPLLRSGGGESELIIHIASEKGLCGGYNAQALRHLSGFMRGRNAREVHGISVGKYASRHIEKVRAFFLQNFTVGERVSIEDVQLISNFIIERFLAGKYSKVFVLYTNFKTVFYQEPVVRQLLPLSKESLEAMIETAGGAEGATAVADYKQNSNTFSYRFEPSKEMVLESILPGLVTTQIYQALLEASASEQSSRMVAMKSATDNATSFGGALTLKYNRARQASITREIIEIAAGADAV